MGRRIWRVMCRSRRREADGLATAIRFCTSIVLVEMGLRFCRDCHRRCTISLSVSEFFAENTKALSLAVLSVFCLN